MVNEALGAAVPDGDETECSVWWNGSNRNGAPYSRIRAHQRRGRRHTRPDRPVKDQVLAGLSLGRVSRRCGPCG
jgi:hypothetical protein